MAQAPQNPEIIELGDAEDALPATFPNNTTQGDRFAVFTKIAKKEHAITLSATGANQGVFADLLKRFPQLKIEVEEQWYQQNRNNTELELCKSKYHGIVNARTTTFINPYLNQTYDGSTVNQWWVVNLFDLWQRLLGRAEDGDRVLAHAFGHDLSEQESLQMQGLTSVQPGCLLLGGQYGPDVSKKSIENDDNNPGPSSGPSLPIDQVQQPSTDLRNSSTKEQGQILNAVQAPIDNIAGPPNKRVKLNTSDAEAPSPESAFTQTVSQVSDGNFMTTMSNQARISRGFGPNLTLPPISQVPTNNRSNQTPESSGLVQSMASSNNFTQAPTRMGMSSLSERNPVQMGSHAAWRPSGPSRDDYPSGMHTHYATPKYSPAQFNFEPQGILHENSMRDPSINSQFGQSSSQGSGFITNQSPAAEASTSNAPASTADGSHTTFSRDGDTCEAELNAQYEAILQENFVSEEQRLRLRGYNQAIMRAYRANNWNRIADIKEAKQELLQGLQPISLLQQNNSVAQSSNPTTGYASQLAVSNDSQSMSTPNSFPAMPLSTLSSQGGQLGRGQVQWSNGFAQSPVYVGSNTSQNFWSNSTHSTAVQNILPAQQPTFVRTGISHDEAHRLMDVEYEDTCSRFGPFNDEEKSRLQGMFRVWGDALVRNDKAAADAARNNIRACRPRHVGSVSTWLNEPNLAAAPPYSNQGVSQASVGTGYLPIGAELSGQASSGGPMQQPNPEQHMNDQVRQEL